MNITTAPGLVNVPRSLSRSNRSDQGFPAEYAQVTALITIRTSGTGVRVQACSRASPNSRRVLPRWLRASSWPTAMASATGHSMRSKAVRRPRPAR